MKYCFWTFVISLFISLTAGGKNLCDFPTVKEAEAFGWLPRNNCSLSIGKPPSGAPSIIATGKAGKGKYRGVLLSRQFSLSGATAKDYIAFKVRQNFGESVCIYFSTNKGSVYKTVSVPQKNKWTTITQKLDYNSWNKAGKNKSTGWSGVNSIAFYSGRFNCQDQYLEIADLQITSDGKEIVFSNNAGAQINKDIRNLKVSENRENWYLGNADVIFAVSKINGQINGAWNNLSGELYLKWDRGFYRVENRGKIYDAGETNDKIQSYKFQKNAQAIEITCSNPGIPELTIVKSYHLKGHKLLKKTTFKINSKDVFFITCSSEVCFAEKYRSAGYYMGEGGLGPLIPAPKVSKRTKITTCKRTVKGMLLSQPEKKYSFFHSRTKLDDHFVWPFFSGCITGFTEEKNNLYYTPHGWDICLGTSKLTPSGTSYEEEFNIFPGDWYKFFTDEFTSEKYAKDEFNNIPPSPEWVKNIVACFGYNDINQIKRFLEMTDDGYVLVLISAMGAWGDYYVDEGLNGYSGGRISGKELKESIKLLQSLSPRVKVGIYNFSFTALANSRIYKKHPEWFRAKDKEGYPINLWPGVYPNYASLLSNRECYNELLHQFDIILDYLNVDYLYLDIAQGINVIDWKTGEYNRDDLCMEFLKDMKKIVARHGKDKALFLNGRGVPYADINYIESRNRLTHQWWRNFSGVALGIETFLTHNPAQRIIPLYWTNKVSREYVNRCLALGWIMACDYQEINKYQFADAAYEIGNMTPVDMTYEPDWKKDKNTKIESYCMKRLGDKGYLLSFISHYKETKLVPVTLALDTLDLSADSTVYIWKYELDDATAFYGCVSDKLAKDIYKKTGWMLDKATKKECVYKGNYKKTLNLNINMKPLILYQLYITTQPVLVYSENNLPANYYFCSKPQVQLETKNNNSKQTEVIVNSKRAVTELIVQKPEGSGIKKIEVDQKPYKENLVYAGGEILPLVSLPEGRHSISIEYESVKNENKIDRLDFFKASRSKNNITVEQADCKGLVCSIEKNGKVLFGKTVALTKGIGYIELSPVRTKGAYEVSVRAIEKQDGSFLTVSNTGKNVSLNAAKVSLGLTPVKGETIAEVKEIKKVGKEIKGVKVLNSAIETSKTPKEALQPNLKALTASVYPAILKMEAGTTRKIDDYRGAAYAGFEISGLKKARLKLENTYYNAFNSKMKHTPPFKNKKRDFAGIMVDYHTKDGYSKRVGFAVGVLHPQCKTSYPHYGKAAKPDEFVKLGNFIDESPEKEFSLDIEKFAPKGWDGKIWISVGSDDVAPDRRLTLSILEVNNSVKNGFVKGVSSKDFMAEYKTPRHIEIPKAPFIPVIDGDPAEELWQAAGVIDTFFLLKGAGRPTAQTKVQLLYDENNLYISIFCGEPLKKKLTTNGNIWNNDEIELWFDINNDKETFYQIIIDCKGDIMELTEKGKKDSISIKAAVSHTKGQWIVEAAIPFSALGLKSPVKGKTCYMSICRHRPAGYGLSKSELIAWSPILNFRDLKNFGKITFK